MILSGDPKRVGIVGFFVRQRPYKLRVTQRMRFTETVVLKLMKIFTRLEEMYRGKTPEYKAQLKKFQDSVTQLSAAGEAKQHG